MKGKVTEDAIIQNIDIGNISMPINSNLIQGAQSLFGVRADLKFGKTTVSGIFSEQRSQSQNITTQGGGTVQDLVDILGEMDGTQYTYIKKSSTGII